MKKITFLFSLLIITITQAQIVNIPDTNFKQVLLNHNPVIDSNGDGEIQISEAEATTYIQASNRSISDITGIEFFKNLEDLYIDYNSIPTLNVSQNLFLKTLDFDRNLIDSVDLSNNVNLESLSCTESILQELDLSNNINLLTLYYSGNLIPELDVSNNINLNSLVCNNSSLTNIIGLENCKKLKTLSCRFNEIENLNVYNCPLLEVFNCESNKIKSIDLSNNGNLTKFICRNNEELKYLNAKNGNNFYMYLYSSGYDYYINLPLLEQVCSDGNQRYNDMLTSEANSISEISFIDSCYTSSGEYNSISGKISYNQDNSCSVLNDGLSNLKILATDGIKTSITFSMNDGNYFLKTEEGNYTTTIENLTTYFNSNPTSANSMFTGFGNTDSADFCLQANQSINDLNILIVPLTESRPGFNAIYRLIYKNVGTTFQNGNLSLSFDNSKLTFINTSEIVTNQTTNELTFNFSNLNPFETRIIDVEFNIAPPPTANVGEVINFTAIINPVSGDNTPIDNTFTLNETLIGSFDPNDIRVLEGTEVLYEDREDYLHYVIRFQNTGTASAINIVVENLLEEKLDLDSFQLLNTSHSCRVAIENGNDIDFIFENINLPDNTNDEPNSHGFIIYKVKPKSSIQIGEIVNNNADIYFDFNPPIITNIANTEIVENQLNIENRLLKTEYKIYPNPTNGILNIITKSELKSLKVINTIGQELFYSQRKSIDLSELNSGIYFLTLETKDGKFATDKIMKK